MTLADPPGVSWGIMPVGQFPRVPPISRAWRDWDPRQTWLEAILAKAGKAVETLGTLHQERNGYRTAHIKATGFASGILKGKPNVPRFAEMFDSA